LIRAGSIVGITALLAGAGCGGPTAFHPSRDDAPLGNVAPAEEPPRTEPVPTRRRPGIDPTVDAGPVGRGSTGSPPGIVNVPAAGAAGDVSPPAVLRAASPPTASRS